MTSAALLLSLLILNVLNTCLLTLSSGNKAHIRRHLSQEARGSSHLVLWLDCDREGENICFEGTTFTLVKLLQLQLEYNLGI